MAGLLGPSRRGRGASRGPPVPYPNRAARIGGRMCTDPLDRAPPPSSPPCQPQRGCKDAITVALRLDVCVGPSPVVRTALESPRPGSSVAPPSRRPPLWRGRMSICGPHVAAVAADRLDGHPESSEGGDAGLAAPGGVSGGEGLWSDSGTVRAVGVAVGGPQSAGDAREPSRAPRAPVRDARDHGSVPQPVRARRAWAADLVDVPGPVTSFRRVAGHLSVRAALAKKSNNGAARRRGPPRRVLDRSQRHKPARAPGIVVGKWGHEHRGQEARHRTRSVHVPTRPPRTPNGGHRRPLRRVSEGAAGARGTGARTRGRVPCACGEVAGAPRIGARTPPPAPPGYVVEGDGRRCSLCSSPTPTASPPRRRSQQDPKDAAPCSSRPLRTCSWRTFNSKEASGG